MAIQKKQDDVDVGVDIEDISRFKGLDLRKNKLFLNKVFSKKELMYCFSKKDPAQHLAVRFAAKEAVVKAISRHNKSIAYKEVEITNNKRKAPVVRLSNKDAKTIKAKISLSHCKEKAIAFAVILKRWQT